MQRFVIQCKNLQTSLCILPALYYLHSLIYLKLDQYDETMCDVQKAIDMEPDNPIHLVQRGHVYYKMGEYEKAKADLSKGTGIDPKIMEEKNTVEIFYKNL